LFADYLTFKAEQRNREAAQVLIMCLAESLAPAGFLGVLLMESLAFLEGQCFSSLLPSLPCANNCCVPHALDEEVLLGENETCEILRHLELVEQGSVYQPMLYFGRLQSKHFGGGVLADRPNLVDLANNPQDHAGKSNAMVIDLDMSVLSKGLDTIRLAAARNLARMDMV
jgi:hypothetical protein